MQEESKNDSGKDKLPDSKIKSDDSADKIRRHLTKKEDTISEEDIKKIDTDPGSQNKKNQNEKSVAKNTHSAEDVDKANDDNKGDDDNNDEKQKPPTTPWDIIE